MPTSASHYTLALLLLPATLGAAQAHIPGAPPQTTQAAPSRDTLLDGTPVKLLLTEAVSSATAKAGQDIPFVVAEDVRVQGVTVIAKGAPALATVVDAQKKRTLGRAGKLDLAIRSVRLVDNERSALRATAGGKAGGHTGVMTGALIASGLLFFPAAPLFLFIHGKDMTLPEGLATTAFIEGDMKLNLASFAQPATAAGNTAGTAVSAP